MRRILSVVLVIVFVFAAAVYLYAQQTYPVNSNGGNIIATNAACVPNACVGITVSGASSITVVVTGTFSATLAVETSADGTTFASAGTITNTGTTSYSAANVVLFRVRASAYVSGNAGVNITTSSGGGGGGTGNVSVTGGISALTGVVSCYDVSPACVSDNTVLDASTTSGSPIVTCPNSDCHFLSTAAVGQLIQGGTSANGPVLGSSGGIPTILSVDSDTQVHASANASATGTGTVYLAWGPDNTASMDALSNASVKVCKYAYLPAGWYLTQHAAFNFANANCANQNSGRVGGVIGAGPGWINTKLLMRYDFQFTSGGPSGSGCNGGLSSNACFFGVLALDIRAVAIDGMNSNVNPAANTFICENQAGYFDRVGCSGFLGSPLHITMMRFTGVEGITRESAALGGANACQNDGTTTQLIINPCELAGSTGISGNSNSYFSKGNYYAPGGSGGGNFCAGGTNCAAFCNSGAVCHHENDQFNSGTVQNAGGTLYLDHVAFGGAPAPTIQNTTSGGTIYIRNSTISVNLTNAAGAIIVDQGGNSFTGTVTNSGIWEGDASICCVLQTAANITPSTGWGTTGAAGNGVSGVGGYTVNESFTITATGTPAANPTVAIVFPKAFVSGTGPAFCMAIQSGGTGAINAFNVSSGPTNTGVTFKWNGTPVAASTYIVSVQCTNR